MTRKEVIELIIGKVSEIQEISGREVVPIGESTVPIGGVPGFDSLNGVEFAAMIDQVVGIGDVGNLCASKDGTHALSVTEIADRILEAATAEKEKS